MQPDDDFYVGYDDHAPPAIARFTRVAVVSLVALSVCAAVVLAGSFSTLPESRFEFGTIRTLEGQLIGRPYPRLVGAVERGSDSEGVRAGTIMLAGQGKHGAAELTRGLDGRRVRLQGTLAQRGTHALLQVEPDTLAQTPASGPPRTNSSAELRQQSRGRQTLRGEIVDSKCYLGVMNPAEGAVHRDCAVRCLSGGIAPALVTRQRDGRASLVYLSSATGDALDASVISKRAGLSVEITGELIVEGDTEWLRVETPSLQRLAR